MRGVLLSCNFRNMINSQHKALLLTNLGSPESPSVKDVRRYLNEFLMDSRVIDFPAVFRFLLMRCIVIPGRAPRSAEAYRKIWRPDGSPLIVLTRALKDKVQQKAGFPVAMSMRYQRPTPKAALDELYKYNPGLKELVVLPLYPHYTMSSFDTAVEQVKRVHRKGKYPFRLRFLNPFYNHPDYIDALSNRIRPYLEKGYDKILFSYHGLPERHLRKDEERMRQGTSADFQLPKINYQQQAFETTRLVTERLNIPEERFEISFQSRLTSAGSEWIKPYTVLRLPELAREGVKKLLVICPAFINDCLETLEEIAIQGKESFLEAGGESLELIPCINDQDQFAETIVRWAENGQ